MLKDLWPNFEITQVTNSPKSIIEEAGAGLNEKTKELVKFYNLRTSIKDDQVNLSFSLYSRALSYHFPFMEVRYAVENPYPVTITTSKMPEFKASNEDELIEALAKVFNAPSTIETVQRLMSLS